MVELCHVPREPLPAINAGLGPFDSDKRTASGNSLKLSLTCSFSVVWAGTDDAGVLALVLVLQTLHA